MLNPFNFFKKQETINIATNSIESMQESAFKVCRKLTSHELSNLQIKDYKYNTAEAVVELGLDEDMVRELLGDYVRQILRTISQFDQYLEELHSSQDRHLQMDFTPFRELAHKNLGVARNLRIKDAEVLLGELMKKDDLSYLLACIEALNVCAIKLDPKTAFEVLSTDS